jgi:hypothetical protein
MDEKLDVYGKSEMEMHYLFFIFAFSLGQVLWGETLGVCTICMYLKEKKDRRSVVQVQMCLCNAGH